MKRFRPEYLESITAQLAEHAGVSQMTQRSLREPWSTLTCRARRRTVSRGLTFTSRGSDWALSIRRPRLPSTSSPRRLAIDARNGLGQVQAMKTLDLLIPRAKKNGVAAATIRNSQHFGALSYYCNRAAEQDMILLAMTNCEPAMSPTGGYEPFFGTNPIAASFPTGTEPQ